MVPAPPEGPGFSIAVFDDRRGNNEGNEEDKILAFWPPETPSHEQAAAVGLIQAMAAFMGTFGGVHSLPFLFPKPSTSDMYETNSQRNEPVKQPHMCIPLTMVENITHGG